jgi:hypothetical protein
MRVHRMCQRMCQRMSQRMRVKRSSFTLLVNLRALWSSVRPLWPSLRSLSSARRWRTAVGSAQARIPQRHGRHSRRSTNKEHLGLLSCIQKSTQLNPKLARVYQLSVIFEYEEEDTCTIPCATLSSREALNSHELSRATRFVTSLTSFIYIYV